MVPPLTESSLASSSANRRMFLAREKELARVVLQSSHRQAGQLGVTGFQVAARSRGLLDEGIDAGVSLAADADRPLHRLAGLECFPFPQRCLSMVCRWLLKTKVVPLLSARRTKMIRWWGSCTSELVFWIVGSSQ